MYLPKQELFVPDLGSWKVAPQRAHQVEGLNKSRGRRGFAWLMEMGTGKTRTDIDETGELFEENEIDGWLILAPRGVYTNWVNEEIPKWMGEETLDALRIGVWDGNLAQYKKDELNALFRKDHNRLDVLLMNTEALGASDKAFDLARMFVRRHKAKVSIDESVLVKNPQAERTKAVMRLRDDAAYRRILCGQPTPNGPMDLFSQMDFCVPDVLGRSFYSYRSRYAVLEPSYFGTRRVDMIVDYRDLDEIAERIAPHSFRKKKDECLDLPPKVYMPFWNVEMTTEQARIYREMKQQCTALLDEATQTHMSATLIITQIARLHQILIGFATDELGGVHMLDSNRPKAMLEWSEEVSDGGIIWCCYRPEINRIVETLRKAWGDGSVVEYHGGCTDAQIEHAKRAFNDGSAKWFVGSQHKGARGLTLLRGRDTLYYANTPGNLDHREQSEDRSHRDGQTMKCTYTDFIVPDTVEGRFVSALRKKMDLATAVLRDGHKQWLV